ncbi:MAG: hypothetical protein EPN22_17530 [Nitrospirae bacterium]|nr:MAG: hypothetical protein EPN22_17530 [Nitrospirota bacterium]
MTGMAKFETLFEAIPADARPHVARVLRQVVHDINTPLSTLAMEVFSARQTLTKLHTIHEGVEVVASLTGICSNAERATSELSEYVAALGKLGTEATFSLGAERAQGTGRAH